ncbi:MAG: hypothetical protein WDN25_18565 [Acetobacteraceae bacterium]
MLLRNGAAVRVGNLVVGDGEVTFDATASLNIGSVGAAIPGTVVVDADHTLRVQPFTPRTFQGMGFLNNGTIQGDGYLKSFNGEADIAFTSGTNNGTMTAVTLQGGPQPDGGVNWITNNGVINCGPVTSLSYVNGPGTIMASDRGGYLSVGQFVTALVDFAPGQGTLDLQAEAWGKSPSATVSIDLTLVSRPGTCVFRPTMLSMPRAF